MSDTLQIYQALNLYLTADAQTTMSLLWYRQCTDNTLSDARKGVMALAS